MAKSSHFWTRLPASNCSCTISNRLYSSSCRLIGLGLYNIARTQRFIVCIESALALRCFITASGLFAWDEAGEGLHALPLHRDWRASKTASLRFKVGKHATSAPATQCRWVSLYLKTKYCKLVLNNCIICLFVHVQLPQSNNDDVMDFVIGQIYKRFKRCNSYNGP